MCLFFQLYFPSLHIFRDFFLFLFVFVSFFFRAMLLIQTNRKRGAKSMSGEEEKRRTTPVREKVFIGALSARDVLIIPRRTTTTWEIDERNPAGGKRRKRSRRRWRKETYRAIVRYKPTERYGLCGGYFNIFQRGLSLSLCQLLPCHWRSGAQLSHERKKKDNIFF